MSNEVPEEHEDQILLTTPEGVRKDSLQRFLNAAGRVDVSLHPGSDSVLPYAIGVLPALVKGIRGEQLNKNESDRLLAVVAALPVVGTGMIETARAIPVLDKRTVRLVLSQLPERASQITGMIERIGTIVDDLSRFENPRQAFQSDAGKLLGTIHDRQINKQLSTRDAAAAVLSEEIALLTDPTRLAEAIAKYPFLRTLIGALNKSHIVRVPYIRIQPAALRVVAQPLVAAAEQAAGQDASLSLQITEEPRTRWGRVIDVAAGVLKGPLIGAIEQVPQLAEAFAGVLPATQKDTQAFSNWLRNVSRLISNTVNN